MESKELKIGKLYEWENPNTWKEKIYPLFRFAKNFGIQADCKQIENGEILLYIEMVLVPNLGEYNLFLDKNGALCLANQVESQNCFKRKYGI